MKLWLGLSALLCALNASAASFEQACTQRQCAVGEIVTIQGNGPKDFYYACPTKALSNYTNGVSGMLEMQFSLTGRRPRFNRITGDPDYEGESSYTVAQLHEDANVPTFHDAIRICRKTWAHARRVKILSVPASNDQSLENMSAFVQDARSQQRYWLPYSYLFALQ